MNKEELPSIPDSDQSLLQAKIDKLTAELQEVLQKLSAFENTLRAYVADEIIAEQELSLLYKQQKKAKKEKRLSQKKRGKNFAAPTGLKPANLTKPIDKNPEDQKEKKRLYREAMLYVHPDKFSMEEEKSALATEVTAKLIDIYQSGDLATLQAYHAHIFSGHALIASKPFLKPTAIDGNTYLEMELQALKSKLAQVKDSYTYRVLTTYDNPMTFKEELKAYYTDRLAKLRKRTRTKA
ncbi:hypothetical protein SAMN04487911_12323 [Arenibacter nanhaiticus]|uniref:DnaJ domain-containing protein n=1 Tax=Arenibacter nanhaiticus TaxID=558155 RepID=A0A1M6JUR5_9FLAO|nr:hypothetical protein [Arenibacter nanhaiticus]SHJ50438.1 hypothetical protein SAMN04487911_12323 [Arenibacter nanhaiticus]